MCTHFGIERWEIVVAPQNINANDIEVHVSNPFSFELNNIIPDVESDAYIELSFDSSNSTMNRQMHIPWRRRDRLTQAVTSSSIENVFQSIETILLGNGSIKLHFVDPRKGKGE